MRLVMAIPGENRGKVRRPCAGDLHTQAGRVVAINIWAIDVLHPNLVIRSDARSLKYFGTARKAPSKALTTMNVANIVTSPECVRNNVIHKPHLRSPTSYTSVLNRSCSVTLRSTQNVQTFTTVEVS